MLSDRNVRDINSAITSELRNVDSMFTSNEDKMAALERISKLKSLLSPQPTRQEIIAELATALKEASPTTSHAQRLVEIISAYHNR